MREPRPQRILLARRARQRPVLVAQLHDSKPYHARIQAQQVPHCFLRCHRAVEAHHKVLALGVPGLVLFHGLGQEEGAPVVNAAHDAAVREDQGAGGAGDAVRERVLVGRWG